MCQRGLRAYMRTYQKRTNQLLLFTWQRANKRFNVTTCQVCVSYSVIFTCSRAKRHAKYSSSPAKNRNNFSTIFQSNFSILELVKCA